MKKRTEKNVEKDNQKEIIEVGETLEELKPKRFRHFTLILYQDTTSYNFEETLRIIKSQKKWAYIKHMPEQKEKKEHFHVILSFDNATTDTALSKKTGVPVQHISGIKNLRSMCRYLIHKDDEEKYQYSLDQVKVSPLFTKEYKKCFDDIETEDEIIDKIYNFIEGLKYKFGYAQTQRLLIQYVNSHCYETIYKRYRFEFTEYLKMCCN